MQQSIGPLQRVAGLAVMNVSESAEKGGELIRQLRKEAQMAESAQRYIPPSSLPLLSAFPPPPQPPKLLLPPPCHSSASRCGTRPPSK